MQTPHNPSRASVAFDDEHLIAYAGLAVVGGLSERLGHEALVQEFLDARPIPRRRVATLVRALVAGATCIDDADVPRSGATSSVLSHRVMAPSTLGHVPAQLFVRSRPPTGPGLCAAHDARLVPRRRSG